MAERVVEWFRERAGSDAPDGLTFLRDVDSRCSDWETRVRLGEDLRRCDAFLFQALLDPTTDLGVDQNHMAFLIAVRTLKSYGANYITGVLTYPAYAPQDKPS
jgi:phosphoribosylpyrophosphate synthetase